MTILLVNDDGAYSHGIEALNKVFSEIARVVIVAPSHEMSATSHKISIRQKMNVKKLGKNLYTLSGSPADCVRYGLYGLKEEVIKFDYVISGINHGLNVGTDSFYSGTIAGAREAVINGIPALSFSFFDFNVQTDPSYYEEAALKGREIFLELQKQGKLVKDLYYNINFPHTKIYKGVRVTSLDKLVYRINILDLESQMDGEKIVFIDSQVDTQKSESSKDFQGIKEGYITITPLSLSAFVDPKEQASLEKIFKS
jgi:5'-nucleotidase